MTDPRYCPHTDHVPVEVRSRTTGRIETVARICLDCLTQLHPGWGCPDCEWNTVTERTLSEPTPTTHHVLAAPCKEHA